MCCSDKRLNTFVRSASSGSDRRTDRLPAGRAALRVRRPGRACVQCVSEVPVRPVGLASLRACRVGPSVARQRPRVRRNSRTQVQLILSVSPSIPPSLYPIVLSLPTLSAYVRTRPTLLTAHRRPRVSDMHNYMIMTPSIIKFLSLNLILWLLSLSIFHVNFSGPTHHTWQ